MGMMITQSWLPLNMHMNQVSHWGWGDGLVSQVLAVRVHEDPNLDSHIESL